MTTNDSIEALNDHTLLSQFGILVRQDHEGNANLLRHIDAIDRRQLWAKLGYPSMFAPFSCRGTICPSRQPASASVLRARRAVSAACSAWLPEKRRFARSKNSSRVSHPSPTC